MRLRLRSLFVAVLAATLATTGLAAGAAAKPNKGGGGTPTTPAPSALVLYDTSGEWGHLGELYAIQAANLVSHFGSWTAKPVSQYQSGDAEASTAVLYLGSTYQEPLPAAFLADVFTTTKPVIWSGMNVWQLAQAGDVAARFGFTTGYFDTSTVTTVRYKGREVTRHELNTGGILDSSVVDPSKASVVAEAVRSDGTTFPWAIRGGGLTYVGEIPFSYATEGDRQLVYADLLFDALAPATAERHRALVRLEDLNPVSDPAQLMAVADYLHSEGVPFAFGLSPVYLDPTGYYNAGTAEEVRLRDNRPLIDAIRYLQSKGGEMVLHGYTHQWSDQKNPYNGVTGDDYEFYRVVEEADHSLTYVGPLPEDSSRWVDSRLDGAASELRAAKLDLPSIFEFPHYAGSDTAYRTVAKRFTTRWERGLYYGGTLTGQPADHSRMVGQMFPYVVRDLYGTKVLPETLGDISPDPWYHYPAKLPADLLANAERNLVVRDGFAAFFFHPYLDMSYLVETVRGIKALGYEFVSPTSL